MGKSDRRSGREVAEGKRLPPSCFMTLQPCQHTEVALPPATSCGALCDTFPACLPPPTTYLLGKVAQLREEADDAYDQAVSSSRTLEAIREALGGNGG